MKCFKPYHGRTIDVVLPYNFLEPTLVVELSLTLDSRSRFLPDDNSLLRIQGTIIVNGMYHHAIYAPGIYHFHIYSPHRMGCDDYPSYIPGQRYAGTWNWFVR